MLANIKKVKETIQTLTEAKRVGTLLPIILVNPDKERNVGESMETLTTVRLVGA